MPVRRPLSLALAVVAGVAAALPVARAAGPGPARVDPLTLPCSDFIAFPPAARSRVALWLDGYIKASRNRPEEVGDTALDRPIDAVLAACQQAPTGSLADAWTTHYPGGQTRTPPMRATCAELLALDPPARDALVSWLEGFGARKRASGAAGPSIPLAPDTARAVSLCKRAPKKSVAKALGAVP